MEPETITAIEAEYTARARRPITLDALARHWLSFAEETATGYRGLVEEFWNDLMGRDRLEDALTRLGDADRRWLRGLVGPGDVAYLAATLDDTDNLLANAVDHGPGWWWLRVPRVPGELLVYLDHPAWRSGTSGDR